jgi:hypothetical protein
MIIKSKHNGYSRDGIRLYHMDLSDDPAPDTTTRITEQGKTTENRTSSTKLPDFVTSNARDIFAKAKTIGDTPYTAYTGNRVAEFTPDMMTAMERMRNQGVAGEIDQASGLAGLAGERASDYGMFQQGIQQYMNPYMQNVVDVERRKAQETADRQSAILSGQAAKQGAFGGSGAALQQRALTRDTAQQLADIQALGLDRAYKSASDQYNTGITNMLSASGQLGGLGTTRFGQETDIIKNLGTSGDIQRQREQALLDEKERAFNEERDYAAKQLALQKSLTSGLEYDTSKEETSVTDPGKKVEQVVGRAAGGLIGNYAQGGITNLLSDQQIDQRQRMSGISDLARMALQAEEMERARMRAAQQGIMAQQPQGTVADEEMARIAAIEQGIGGLDVPENLVGDEYTAAGGGIVAFSNLGEVPAMEDEIVRRAKIKQRQGVPLTSAETAAVQGGATRLNTNAGEPTSGSMGILDSIYGPQEKLAREANAKEVANQKAYMEDLGKEKGETKDFASKARQKIEEKMAGLEGSDKSALESSVLDFGLRLLSAKGEKNMAKALAGAGLDTLAGHKQALKEIAAKRDRYEDSLMKVDEFEYGENKGTRKEERAARLNLGKAEAELSKDLNRILGARGDNVLQLYRDRESRAHAARTAGINSQSVDRQTFDALVKESGGDIVAARKKYNALTGAAKSDPYADYRKELLGKRAEIIAGPLADSDMGKKQLASIDAELKTLSGESQSGGQSGGRMGTPTAAHIDALKKNPAMAAEFDRKFGPGASAQYVK